MSIGTYCKINWGRKDTHLDSKPVTYQTNFISEINQYQAFGFDTFKDLFYTAVAVK